jgi:nucleoid DNA-binding protein
MNKADLTQELAKKFEFSANKANEILTYTFELMSKALAKNDTVQLIGFGSFSVRKRKARDGRNPSTGETIKIPASKAVKFSVGKALKEAVNKK